MNGSVSWVPGRHWSSAPSRRSTDSGLCELSKTPHVCFQSLSSPPAKKHFLISHLSNHISPLHCMSARPSHSMHGLERLKKKKRHLWETNQPFPNYMPLFRQIKPLINATILEGEESSYLPNNTSFTCFDSVRTCVTIKEGWVISSAWWKKPPHSWRIAGTRGLVFLSAWEHVKKLPCRHQFPSLQHKPIHINHYIKVESEESVYEYFRGIQH